MSNQLLSIVILAGGRSQRMGQDKAWLDVAGRPLVEHVARRLAPLAAEIIFSTNHPAPFLALGRQLPVPARIAPDREIDAGPLAGLEAGLAAASQPLVFAAGVDMPFVNAELVAHMASLVHGYDAVIPRIPPAAGGPPLPEPLHAIYRRSCLLAISRRLHSGERRLVSFLPDVVVRYATADELDPVDPGLRSFLNVNTPSELDEARSLLTSPT